MKPSSVILFVAAICLALVCQMAGQAKPGVKKAKTSVSTPQAAAQSAARSWLALVDAGKYGESWDTAAPSFQSQINKGQWITAIQSVRGPLGKVQSRMLKSAQYTKSIPNAPPGEYVVITYDTLYAKKGASVETIVPMRDKDGKWKVSGYFIK